MVNLHNKAIINEPENMAAKTKEVQVTYDVGVPELK